MYINISYQPNQKWSRTALPSLFALSKYYAPNLDSSSSIASSVDPSRATRHWPSGSDAGAGARSLLTLCIFDVLCILCLSECFSELVHCCWLNTLFLNLHYMGCLVQCIINNAKIIDWCCKFWLFRHFAHIL